MRSASFHFAIRSERAKEPTLSWSAPQPTARWTIDTSSLSPERAETMARHPAARAAASAARVSLTVPAWLGLISTALHGPRGSSGGDARGRGDEIIVADDLHRSPAAAVKARMPALSSSAAGSSTERIG